MGLNDSDEEPLLSRQEMIQAQDRGLDDLAQIIRRQRDIGIIIGNEVDEQNGIASLFLREVPMRFRLKLVFPRKRIFRSPIFKELLWFR